MKWFRLALGISLAIFLMVGCVEELERGENIPPRVWFERGPTSGSVIFSNAAEFEWKASDVDDDLGMGTIKTRLDTIARWYDEDSLEIAEGPDSVMYHELRSLIDLPDCTFIFNVIALDQRGGMAKSSRMFTVRFDPEPPKVDKIIAPPGKAPKADFKATYVVYAHDVAPNPGYKPGDPDSLRTLPYPVSRAASPPESLRYEVRMVGPGCFDTIELEPVYGKPEGSFEYKVDIPGSVCHGKYTFRCKVRDRADNATEVVASFEIPR